MQIQVRRLFHRDLLNVIDDVNRAHTRWPLKPQHTATKWSFSQANLEIIDLFLHFWSHILIFEMSYLIDNFVSTFYFLLITDCHPAGMWFADMCVRVSDADIYVALRGNI